MLGLVSIMAAYHAALGWIVGRWLIGKVNREEGQSAVFYFAGLEIDEVAECLEISPATVKRDWEFARTWMRAELREPA